jgi:hypothetical protein
MTTPTPTQQQLSTQSMYFSHTTYDKLRNIDVKSPITLLETFVKTINNLSAPFLEYDTTYHVGENKFNFHLIKGSYIVLLFIDSNAQLFTTIRPHTVKKLDYYNAMRGRKFMVEFKEFDRPNEDTIKLRIPKI